MKKIIGSLFIAISSISFSQIEELPVVKLKKNSFGLEYRSDYGYANIGLNYRRYFENSKYNFRANIYFGEEEGEYINFPFENGFENSFNSSGMTIATTNDTNFPTIGINNGQPQNGSFQKIELGIERTFSLWKLNIIGGVDVTLGHSFRSGYRDIVEATLYTYSEDGLNYFQFGEREFDSTYSGEPINSLTINRNYFSFGLLTRLGLRFDISKRLFATGLVGLRLEQELMIGESINYKNDLFKNILTYERGFNTFNFHGFASIGLHYRF